MITTKKGQAGKVTASFSNHTDFMKPFVLPEFQNRYGTGSYGKPSGSPIYSWGERLTDAARTGYTPSQFFETGYVTTNAVTMSGGTDKNQMFFSAASVNSRGIVPNNRYDRYNFTFRNTSHFLKDRLRVDVGANYIVQKDRNMINQGVYSNPLVSVVRALGSRPQDRGAVLASGRRRRPAHAEPLLDRLSQSARHG